MIFRREENKDMGSTNVVKTTTNYKDIITKEIGELTPELIQEVIDFIEFLKIKNMKKTGVDYDSLLIQQENVGRVWNQESEDLYEL